MKKSLILGILGLAAVSSYGQSILFGNYTGSGYVGSAIQTAAIPGTGLNANEALGSQYSMSLLWYNGTAYQALGSAISFLDGVGYAGYLSQNPAIQIPGWTSGAVTLEYYAANTVTIGVHAPGEIFGHSLPFTMTPVDNAAPAYPDLSLAVGYSAFTVAAVPEPSTLALAGLGLAALVAYRRKQA